MSLYPLIRYRDVHAGIDFLCRAFGFERREVHEEGGAVVHAELIHGGQILMLGPLREGQVNGPVYVGVADADAAHARAVEAGAEITRQLEDQDYGSRDFWAKDPEGNEWYFGTYDPLTSSS